MQDDIDTILNDLLCKWHGWASGYQHASGYPSRDATCRGYRTSKQYDFDNGAMDSVIDNQLNEAVDAAVSRVDQPWRTALAMHARNLATGANVWNSPRLPSSREERAVLLIEAKSKLMLILHKDGML